MGRTARRPRRPGRGAEALRRSHGELRDRLTVLAEDLLAELPCGAGLPTARGALVDFVEREIIPHAAAEEEIAQSVSDGSLQLLVRALPGHHGMLQVLADEIAAAVSSAGTAAAVGALVLLCDARWDGEDEALVPALAAAGVDLQRLVEPITN